MISDLLVKVNCTRVILDSICVCEGSGVCPDLSVYLSVSRVFLVKLCL